MTIDVRPRDLRMAAAAMEAANEQVENANPSDRMAEISSGLPGGASASQVAPFVSAFDARFEDWCDGATQQSDGYRGAACDYETTDHDAGSEGRRQQTAAGVVGDHWPSRPAAGSGFNRGPAIFRPGDTVEESLARIAGRMDGDH